MSSSSSRKAAVLRMQMQGWLVTRSQVRGTWKFGRICERIAADEKLHGTEEVDSAEPKMLMLVSVHDRRLFALQMRTLDDTREEVKAMEDTTHDRAARVVEEDAARGVEIDDWGDVLRFQGLGHDSYCLIADHHIVEVSDEDRFRPVAGELVNEDLLREKKIVAQQAANWMEGSNGESHKAYRKPDDRATLITANGETLRQDPNSEKFLAGVADALTTSGELPKAQGGGKAFPLPIRAAKVTGSASKVDTWQKRRASEDSELDEDSKKKARMMEELDRASEPVEYKGRSGATVGRRDQKADKAKTDCDPDSGNDGSSNGDEAVGSALKPKSTWLFDMCGGSSGGAERR